MLTLREIMTTDLVTVTPDMSVRDAMDLMASRHISGAPVLERGRIVGIVSMTDLLLLATALPSAPPRTPSRLPDDTEGERLARLEVSIPIEATVDVWGQRKSEVLFDDVAEEDESLPGPEWSPLDEHTVAEAMSTSVITMPADSDVRAAGATMSRERVHRLLVLDGERLAGIVTALDLARAVADHRLRADRYAYPSRGPRDNRQADDTELNP